MNRHQRRAARKLSDRGGQAQRSAHSPLDVAAHLHRTGRFEEAEAVYREALARNPKDAQSLRGIATIAFERGLHEPAVQLLQHVIILQPNDAEAYSLMGGALKALGRLDEALDACRKAVALSPHVPSYHSNLGTILQDRGELGDAIAAYRQAINLDRNHHDANLNLGAALSKDGRLSEACTVFRRIIDLYPDNPAAYWRLGHVLHRQGRLLEAVTAFKQGLTLRSDKATALSDLGAVLRELGRTEEALDAFRFASQLAPDLVQPLFNAGGVYVLENKIPEAINAFEKVLRVNPRYVPALVELCQLQRAICDWTEVRRNEAQLLNLCSGTEIDANPFQLLASPISPLEHLNVARTRSAMLAVPAEQQFPKRSSRSNANGRVRIGYVSADFYNHATTHLITELIERHDRSRFEVIAYSNSPDDGSYSRQRIVRAFDRFIEIGPMAHFDAAREIHDDGVDILVDLKGYTRDSRTQVFAYRPAPIQVNYLGYPGSLGADFIDYIIADPIVAPMSHQTLYTEKIVHLPHSYQPNDTQRHIADFSPSRAGCGLPEDGFVFCCFNNTYKITPVVFDVWMRLLKAVPGSVLWLLDAGADTKANLRREAVLRGVDSARLVFAPKLAPSEHLARHSHADLFLDTLPVNAHTTATDALWGGIPVVTCLGEGFAGRVAGSVLRAVGLPDLVTSSLEEYESLSLSLALDANRLASIKTQLHCNKTTCPLYDIKSYTGHLEEAFTRMVEIWEAGRSPEAFAIESTGSQ